MATTTAAEPLDMPSFGCDDGAIYDFPTFEAQDTDERPPAPSEDDYPAGCEVELVDVQKAKTAQTEKLWEPFMDALFSGRRKVRVMRHTGEYTFVECRDDPEFIIGCTLYRACLKEPKVKFKRYNPYEVSESVAAPVTLTMTVSGGDPSGCGGVVLDDDDDALAQPLAPGSAVPSVPALVDGLANGSPLHHGGSSGGGGAGGVAMFAPTPPTQPSSVNVSPHALVAAAAAGASSPAGPSPPVGSALPGSTGGAAGAGTAHGGFTQPQPSASHQARRMRDKGNKAFQESRFEEAVTFYTAALEMGYDDKLRIYSNRSAAFLALRQTDRALEDARLCIRADPRKMIGYVREANVMRSLKRYDAARKLYARALQLEPDNADINYAMLCNSIAEFFRVRTENLPVSVTLRQESSIIEVVSRRKHTRGETVFVEVPHVVMPLQAHLVDGGHFCGECLRSLVRKEQVAEHVGMREARHLVNSLFPEFHHVVPCADQCGHRYCSEACRNKAWTNHHWKECAVRGQWGREVRLCRQQVEAFGGALNDVTKARVMLAVRMLITMCSSGKPLSEAVSTFMWLPTPTPQPAASTGSGMTGTAADPVLDECLRTVFSTLQSRFGRDENALLDWALFQRTFAQAGAAIAVRCTPWTNFSSKVEAHLALLTQRNDRSGVAEALQEMLLVGRRIPNLSVDCLAIMSIFALCAQQRHATASAPSCNVELKPEADSTTSIHVVARDEIRRGTSLIADPRAFIALSGDGLFPDASPMQSS